MKRSKLDKDIVMVLGMTLITLSVWVGMEVYRAYTRVTPPEGVEQYLTPIDPNINEQILDKLEVRRP